MRRYVNARACDTRPIATALVPVRTGPNGRPVEASAVGQPEDRRRMHVAEPPTRPRHTPRPMARVPRGSCGAPGRAGRPIGPRRAIARRHGPSARLPVRRRCRNRDRHGPSARLPVRRRCRNRDRHGPSARLPVRRRCRNRDRHGPSARLPVRRRCRNRDRHGPSAIAPGRTSPATTHRHRTGLSAGARPSIVRIARTCPSWWHHTIDPAITRRPHIERGSCRPSTPHHHARRGMPIGDRSLIIPIPIPIARVSVEPHR